MIKNLNCYIFIATLTIFLSGCFLHIKNKPVPVKEAKISINCRKPLVQVIPIISSFPFTSLSQIDMIENQNQILHSQLRINNYDWNSTVQSMVEEMLKTQNIITGSVLLVDKIGNKTNGRINAEKATKILRTILTDKNKFILVSSHKLLAVRKKLGLSLRDNFNSLSKAVGIARNVGAQYLLCSSAVGNMGALSLKMQLILVKTGEIIWSRENNVVQL